MRLIQLVFNSKLFLQWPKTLLKRCFQNMMQRYTSSLYMNVSGFGLTCAYMIYFAYLTYFACLTYLSQPWTVINLWISIGLTPCWVFSMLLSVFFADKSHHKGMSHHPVYRKCLFCIYFIFCVYFAYFAYFVSSDQIRCTCTIYVSYAKYVQYAKICNSMHILHILHMSLYC